jgi:hypothetical protein
MDFSRRDAGDDEGNDAEGDDTRRGATEMKGKAERVCDSAPL